jgi:hypothetical protein
MNRELRAIFFVQHFFFDNKIFMCELKRKIQLKAIFSSWTSGYPIIILRSPLIASNIHSIETKMSFKAFQSFSCSHIVNFCIQSSRCNFSTRPTLLYWNLILEKLFQFVNTTQFSIRNFSDICNDTALLLTGWLI